MKYEINTECIINFDNPTPVKKNVEVAINIEPVEKDNGIFENFVLMIHDVQQCCEWWDVFENIEKDCFNKPVMVESIEVFECEEDKFEEFCKKGYIDQEFKTVKSADNIFVEVKLKDKKTPIVAGVFNQHNGYYSHYVYYSNEELKVDVLEKTYL